MAAVITQQWCNSKHDVSENHLPKRCLAVSSTSSASNRALFHPTLPLEGRGYLLILANLLRGHTLLWLHHRHLLLLHGLLLLCLIRACSAVVIAGELIVLALGRVKVWERHYDLSFESYVELKMADCVKMKKMRSMQEI
jgi:hypothetical protein